MSGGEAHVENSIWMRAVLFGGVFLAIGLLAFATMGVGVANVKHADYDKAVLEYEEAKHDYEEAKANNASQSEIDSLKLIKEEAHHHEVDAHLSYLTWRTAGITILLMCITYASFIGVGGFINSIFPDDHGHGHDNHGYGGDGHEHHGSGSPIVFSFGIMLFLMGFPTFQAALGNMLSGLDADLSDLGVSMLGLMIVTAGVANWWREDLPFIGNGEQIATSHPFEGQHIRKAGLWVFIMSEVMVFATFFSSYLRMRTEWCTGWQVEAGNCAEINMLTASDFLRPDGGTLDGLGGEGDFMTLLPGAINTFALIISSYTIVLALKTAKSGMTEADWKETYGHTLMGKIMPTKKAAIRNYLIATFLLGSTFIVLKLIEWSHLVAEGFTIGTQAGSIFYVATGAHGLHVFIGLLVMLYLIFKADTVGFDEKNGQGIEYFGLYWHFVDLAWVVIFPAFYLY